MSRKNRNRNKSTRLNTASGSVFGNPINGGGNAKGAGGYGVNQPGSRGATGNPTVNPFVIPKSSGLTQTTQVYPSNYYVDWSVTAWRSACDQAIKMGYTQAYATLTTWVFEKSPFVQSLFLKLGMALDKIPFFVNDAQGNEIPELTLELCAKPWQMQLRREILFSYFWGFTGLNFDPWTGKVYKYPQQQIDPINRMLKANTFSFYDGELFDDNANLLFIQPSTSYESFLGWMQPISVSYIQMNVSSNNWLAAGRRLAFPVMTVGYPQDDGSVGADGKPVNNYRDDAIAIARDLDPMEAQVYPYTMDDKGNIIKSVVIEFEKPGTAANMHKIFQEFNSDQKADIEIMVYGRALTTGNSKGGNRALGEVEERALDDRIAGLLPYVLAVLNDDYKRKISQFYTNLPEGWQFGYNVSKQLTFADIEAISNAVTANGKRLTTKFFEDNGLAKDYIEDIPEPTAPTKPLRIDPALQMSGLKKKYY